MFLEPRIPPNTGNAIRMVAATGANLHLVEPLGFDLSEPKLKRAGLDYHDMARVHVHPSLVAFWAAVPDARVFAFTAASDVSFASVSYQPGDVLLFGGEPEGLPAEVLADPRLAPLAALPRTPPLDVGEPTKAVLLETPAQFRAVRVHLVEPGEAVTGARPA